MSCRWLLLPLVFTDQLNESLMPDTYPVTTWEGGLMMAGGGGSIVDPGVGCLPNLPSNRWAKQDVG